MVECTILCGPNGSGKSTIYSRLTLTGQFINSDVVARELSPQNPESASLIAGRMTLNLLSASLKSRGSFVYETTLSSHQSIALMRRALDFGYRVSLIFVSLNSVELNVRRVAERVSRGGHDIPEAVIRRRYDTSLKQLPTAIALAETCMLFDNSEPSGPRLLIKTMKHSIEFTLLDAENSFHRRLAEAVGAGLAIPQDAVYRSVRPG